MRTLAQRKEVLKPFFRWLRGTDDKDPPETKGLKVKRIEDHIPTDALITRDDLAALLQAHVDVQEKARIALLYESGFRAGEFCALNVGSVAFEELEGGAWSAVPRCPRACGASRRARAASASSTAWTTSRPGSTSTRIGTTRTRRCGSR